MLPLAPLAPELNDNVVFFTTHCAYSHMTLMSEPVDNVMLPPRLYGVPDPSRFLFKQFEELSSYPGRENKLLISVGICLMSPLIPTIG